MEQLLTKEIFHSRRTVFKVLRGSASFSSRPFLLLLIFNHFHFNLFSFFVVVIFCLFFCEEPPPPSVLGGIHARRATHLAENAWLSLGLEGMEENLRINLTHLNYGVTDATHVLRGGKDMCLLRAVSLMGVKENKRKELGDRGKGIGKRAIALYEINRSK